MKKIMLFFVLAILMHQGVFSQETEILEMEKQETIKQETKETTNPEKSFSILTSPALLLVDFIYFGMEDIYDSLLCMMDLEGQYSINRTLTVALGFSFYAKYYSHPNYDYIDSYSWSTDFHVNFKPTLNFKPSKTGLSDYFIGMFAQIGFRNDFYASSGVYTELGLGFNTGYKWVLRNGFTMQLGSGISKLFFLPAPDNNYSFNWYNSDGSINFPNYTWHIVDFKLGYSF